MKRKSFIILLLIALPILSFAAEKERLAEEMMKLTEMEKLVDPIIVQMKKMQAQIMTKYDISEENRDKIIQFQKRINSKILTELSWDKMKNDYIKLFADVYTEEELKGIVEFYKSSIGQSLIKKQPQIMQKSMAIAQNKVQSLIPEIRRMTQEFEKSIKNE